MGELATELQRLRRDRGVSLGAAARRAGIAKSTLSAWEAAGRTPCIDEIESLLEALGVTADERLGALDLLEIPRGRRQVRLVADVRIPDVDQLAGGIVRAMRRRRGLTQAAAAQLLGIGQPTLSRWEGGRTHPSPAEVTTLCETLGGLPAEAEALRQGPHAWRRIGDALFPGTAGYHERLSAAAFNLVTSADVDLRSVRFACLVGGIAMDCARGREAPSLLALALSLQAAELIRTGEFDLAQSRLTDAVSAVGRGAVARQAPRVIPLQAELAARKGAMGIAAAVSMLAAHVNEITIPAVRSWVEADLARLSASQGDPVSVEMARRACGHAEDDGNVIDIWHRQMDLARVFLARGDPARAAQALEAAVSLPSATFRVRRLLLGAEVLRATGEPEGARFATDTAMELARSADVGYLIPAAH